MDGCSQHLQHLRRAGLVAARRQANFVLYRLADEAVLTLLAAMHKVAERNVGEVERILSNYFRARDDLEPMSRTELAKRMKQGLVTVLDVRPEDEFALGHLPGARNVPLCQLKRQLSKLDRKAEIVACRGPYCVLSFEAVARLMQMGCFCPLFHSTTSEAAKTMYRERLALHLGHVDRHLSSQDYMLGKQFSLADPYLLVVLNRARLLDDQRRGRQWKPRA